jgi:hypothetical protein
MPAAMCRFHALPGSMGFNPQIKVAAAAPC